MKLIFLVLGLLGYPLWGISQTAQRDSVVFLRANTIELTSNFPEDDLYHISQVYLIGQGYQLETNPSTHKLVVGVLEDEALSKKHKVRIQIRKDGLFLQWEHPLNQSMGYAAISYLPSSPYWPIFEALADELKGYLKGSDKYYLNL
ncbi:hypothetical protein [Siphonobacter sp. SORGH_AS_1065]|uniref:hypothetical protein n=1 Tax=Siphonobacter sp. SORGH_AS_1065 TaxID=3041795 RepID=UPI002787A053|nr:hypothetical protein [Siphonobacter sp. SORGH_AS_1065]MDQ1090046.1 hypothetical protein [Siphonobacter sp. SORGH_AS_1065]